MNSRKLNVLPWVVLLGIVLFLLFVPFGGNETSFYYVLSALSQGMAAVFALTFTISLVVAQLNARYDIRLLERLLTPRIIGYILYFGFVVLFPLFVLSYPVVPRIKLPFILGVKFSFFLAALALVLLIPYFRYYLSRISPHSFIKELAQEGIRKLEEGIESREIEIIEMIAMSAQGSRDYSTFNLALVHLQEMALCNGQEVAYNKYCIEGLGDITYSTMNDPRAWQLAQAILENVGRKVPLLPSKSIVYMNNLMYETISILAKTVRRSMHQQIGDPGNAVISIASIGLDFLHFTMGHPESQQSEREEELAVFEDSDKQEGGFTLSVDQYWMAEQILQQLEILAIEASQMGLGEIEVQANRAIRNMMRELQPPNWKSYIFENGKLRLESS